MRRCLSKRPPVYGQHREEEDDDEEDFQSKDDDVFLPSRGSRGLGREVALGEPWQRWLGSCGPGLQG